MVVWVVAVGCFVVVCFWVLVCLLVFIRIWWLVCYRLLFPVVGLIVGYLDLVCFWVLYACVWLCICFDLGWC